MITIDQLLESVDLDFEPRFVTKDKDGTVCIWEVKPERCDDFYRVDNDNIGEVVMCPKLKLSEFYNKDWTECIYEVPRKDKPVVKIEKLNLLNDSALLWGKKINELVAAVNELKGAKNE